MGPFIGLFAPVFSLLVVERYSIFLGRDIYILYIFILYITANHLNNPNNPHIENETEPRLYIEALNGETLYDRLVFCFFVASKRLYGRVCPSVGWSVGPSVSRFF